MKILLTGGGTAGHVWPIILIGQSLIKNKRVKLLYVGSRQGIERKLFGQTTIPCKFLVVGKRRAYTSIANFWDVFKTLIGVFQAFFIIIFFKPDIIFAKGGYVTVPIIFCQKIFNIPLVIHESDGVIGRANLWASKKAKKICLGFPIEEYNQDLPLNKVIYTGTPVNSDFFQTPIRTGSRLKILVTGGSQGASKINSLISEILPELASYYDINHLSGKLDYPKLSEFKNQYYHVFDFTDQMPKFIRDADLIISRAGASSLAEISAAGKASIIIPLETAAGEHQEANARVYQKRNAAVVVSEKNLTANSLKSIIASLMEDKSMRKLLGHHAHEFFQPNAVENIVDVIFESNRK